MNGFFRIQGRGVLKSRTEGVAKESKKPYRLAKVVVMNESTLQAFTTNLSLDEQQFASLPPDGTPIEFLSDAEPQEKGYGYDARAFTVRALPNELDPGEPSSRRKAS